MNTVFQQLSDALAPHRQALQDTIYDELCQIKRLLEHGNRISDLGKPDTGDKFLRIVKKGKFAVGERLAANSLGMPRPGEYWLLQALATNGLTLKSPAAVIRSTAGNIIAVFVKEGMGQEVYNGTIVVLPGEEIFLEPAAEGEYDFTLFLVRRRIPAQVADAGQGVAQGDDINLRAHSGEHEPERYIPDMAPEWQGVDVPSHLQPMSPGYGGAIDPDEIIGGEPVSIEPET